jgi:hypothetical protein
MNYTELKKYLDDGGDPNAYNHNGWSMLFYYIGRLDCFELLLERGANPNQSYFKNDDQFPLFHDVGYCNIRHIKLLLKFGADPNCMNDGYTPLHKITSYYSVIFIELFNLLMNSCANINIKTKHGDSCMDLLVKEHLKLEYYNNCRIELRLQQQSSIETKFNLFMKHNCPLKYHPRLKQVPKVLKYWCKRKWVLLLAVVKLLSLHQRAVVSANHPNRLKQMGVFNVSES